MPQPDYTPAGPAAESYRFRRSDYLLLILAGAGLVGATLIGNPAPGGRPWPAGSVLEHIVWLVSLGYGLSTTRGVEIKSLLVALISALLLIGATVRMIRRRVQLLDDWQGFRSSPSQRVGAATLSVWAVLLLIGWGWLSASWSADAALAFGSVWVFSLGWVWAAGLALHGHRLIVRRLADVMLAVAAVMAVLALWYWRVRSIDTRLGWPMGNPLLLASVMVPTVIIGAGRLVEQIDALRTRGWQLPRVMGLPACILAVGLATATLLATGSRGPVLAALVGLAVAVWLSLPRTARVAWGLVGLVVLAMAAPIVAQKVLGAGGGRDASARMRLYAWQDALDLAWQKPTAGQGAGGFARLDTSLAAHNTVIDPLAMGGEVSTQAHCEMLELLADLGIFGLCVGLAIWVFAAMAAGAKTYGDDRWMAAAIAGAIVAVFLDACTGVSWRMPGSPAFMAMPVAMAWMLWRRPRDIDSPNVRRGFTWPGIIPAVVGLAVATAGMMDFAAARFFYSTYVSGRQAELLRQDARQQPLESRQALLRQSRDLTKYAVEQADLAKRWRLDPQRRLEAWLAAGRLREQLAYQPLLAGKTDSASLAEGRRVLDEGIAILTALNAVAPDFADLRWRIAELLSGKAGLTQQPAQAQEYRGQALNEALHYFDTYPLDADRIWRALAIWPEIPPAQRLQLLRGMFRQESQVWKPSPTFSTGAYQRWSERHWYLNRPWNALGAQAHDVAAQSLELAHSQLPSPYQQWQHLLAPEGVRIAAWSDVLAGKPADAADTLTMASRLYERSNGLLPYSQADTAVELAACRIRQGKSSADWARAALVEAGSTLQSLPNNWVRQQTEQTVGVLGQAIDVIAGQYTGDDPQAWQAAVDLFWDMPPQTWPAEIDAWAKHADELLAGRKTAAFVSLQLAIARGDAKGAQELAEQLQAQGVSRQDLDAIARQAGYRWPWRQELSGALTARFSGANQPVTP